VPPRIRGREGEAQVKDFEDRTAHQRDLLYGVALLYEGIAVLYAGQEQAVATYRKQLRNIIRDGGTRVDRAELLMDEVRKDPARLPELGQFTFNLGEGHADPEGLVARAGVLVEMYEELFPGRDRSLAFTAEETLLLIETAAGRLCGGSA